LAAPSRVLVTYSIASYIFNRVEYGRINLLLALNKPYNKLYYAELDSTHKKINE